MSEARNTIGTVVKISGQAFAEADGHRHPLAEGSTVCEGETVVTAGGSKVEIRFTDNTVLSQGENSRIELDEYVYEDDKGAAGLFFNMVQGSFRTVTGKIVEQNPEGFNLSSPLATIGIRGTTTFHQIGPDGEKHGVQNIANPSLGDLDTPLHGVPSGYHTMLVTFSNGETRIIADSYQMVDLTSAGIGLIRTFTLNELLDFVDLSARSPEERNSLVDTLLHEFQEQAPHETHNGHQSSSEDNPHPEWSVDGVQDSDGGEQSGQDDVPSDIAQIISGLHLHPIIQSGGENGADWILRPDDLLLSSGSDLDPDSDPVPTLVSLIGTDGNDTIVGTEYPDIIQGLGGDDSLSGLGGSDILQGGEGNDILHGGAGDDFLYGGPGNDTVYGETGDDYVQAGEIGHNTYSGGEGIDLISYAGVCESGMTIDLFSNKAYDGNFEDTVNGNDILDTISGFEIVVGSDFDDTIYGGYDAEIIMGGSGNDVIHAGYATKIIMGGEGNDTIYGDFGTESIDGGAGDDEIYGSESTEIIIGGDGNDFISWEGNSEIIGGQGSDTFFFYDPQPVSGIVDSNITAQDAGVDGAWIYDFTSGEDIIRLSNDFGYIDDINFYVMDGSYDGTGLGDGSVYVYDSLEDCDGNVISHRLIYDPDGDQTPANGEPAYYVLASFSGDTELQVSDIEMDSGV